MARVFTLPACIPHASVCVRASLPPCFLCSCFFFVFVSFPCFVCLPRCAPTTQEMSLFHLCDFIEDCEFTALSTQILSLVGELGPSTSAPARYIRFIYNR